MLAPPSGRSTRRLVLIVLALVASWSVSIPASATAPGSAEGAAPAQVDHPTAARAGDPRYTRALYVNPSDRAAHREPAFAAIVSRAQPMWLTDYLRTPAQAETAVRGYVTGAERARRTPTLVVYNIPDRDCGAYSSPDDDITDASYRSWVSGVAAGLRGSHPIVVLEPDAIALIDSPSCTGQGDRLGLLRFATRALTRAGAWVYLDAGHSAWHATSTMAGLLKKAGVARARGFATNVASTRSSTDEAAYSRALIKDLAARKVRGVRYVVDTSRNGAGRAGPAAGDYCNPTEARLGASPGLVFDGAFDGRLWVKRPGESDGTCNGGPSAGGFYPDGACRLQGRTAYDPSTRRCR